MFSGGGNYSSWMTTSAISATAADFGNEIQDNYFDEYTVMKAIKKYGGIEYKNTGDEFTVPIIIEGGTAQWFGRTTKMNDTMPDPVVTSEWQMKFMQVPLKIYWTDEVKNRQSKGKIFNFVKMHKDVARQTYEEEFETAFFRSTPSSSLSMECIHELVDSTGTVGSINPSTYTTWVSTETSMGSFASNGITYMQNMLITLGTKGSKLDVIFFSTTDYGYYLGEAEDRHILSNEGSKLGFGVGKVPFTSIPCEISTKLAAGTIFYFDFSTVKLRVNRGATTLSEWIYMENEQAKKSHLLYCLALYIINRRKNGKHTGVTA